MKIEWIKPDPKMQDDIAHLPGVHRAVMNVAREKAAVATGYLMAHRAEGHSSIEVTRGTKTDAFVSLKDKRSKSNNYAAAAAAIEFGRSGERPTQGVRALSRAFGLAHHLGRVRSLGTESGLATPPRRRMRRGRSAHTLKARRGLIAMTFSVDWSEVILPILRGRLPGVTVQNRVPDGVPEFVPLVVVRRTGGSSDHPWHYDQPWLVFQHWDGPHDGLDAARNAHNLADDVRRALWEALHEQETTDAGHIVSVRESSAPEEINDPDVPMLVRFQATYELQIRRNPAMP